jgi:hypothetical protein
MDVATLTNRAQRIAGRVDSGFDSRTVQFLNEAVEHWARANPWPGLRRTGEFVADGTRNLILPQHVFHVQWIADKTNKFPLEAKDLWDREARDEYLGDTTGPAFWWREVGVTPITQQPTTPALLTVRTDVSDSFSAHIAGIAQDTTASGTANYEYFTEEQLNVAGSAAVSTVNYYIRVMTVGKNDFTAGDLKVYNGSTLIGRIAANRYRSEYRNVEFLTIPEGGTLLRIGYLEAPNPLTAAYQNPHPSINPEFLVWYAAGLIHKAQNESDQGELCIQRALQILNARSFKEKDHGDQDHGLYPDQGYWGSENLYSWP